MTNEKQAGSQPYLWVISSIAGLGGLLFGYDVVVVSGIIPQVINQFDLGSFELGFLVSSVLWGCVAGSVLGGFSVDAFGRKRMIVAASLIMFVSALWSGFASSIPHLIAARLLGGVGCGLAATVCPLYISEISPEKNRGRMVTLYHFAVCFGIVVCVLINWGIFSYATSRGESSSSIPIWQWLVIDQNWRAMLLSEAVVGFFFLLPALLLPESPRWLVKKNRTEEAESVLAKINGSDKAREVCSEITETVALETNITFTALFTAALRRPLLLAVLICIFSEACGISAVLYYGPQLFEQAGLTLGDALGGFFILSIVNMAFNLVAMYFLDTMGRRRMLAIGATGAMLCLIAIGTLYLSDRTGIVSVFFTIGFIACFAFSIGPIKFVVLSEIFPNRIRGKAISIGTLCIWLTSAAVAQLFPMMREVIHTGYIFFFFAADVGALLLVNAFLMPETGGRTIEEIERTWLLSKQEPDLEETR